MQKKFIIIPFVLSLFSLLFAGPPDTLWTRTYGGTDWDIGYSVQQTNDGGFIIAGQTASFGAGWLDVYLIRTNSNGDTLWTRTYGDSSYEKGYSVQQTNDGGFIIAGYTGSFGIGETDVYLIRTKANGDTVWTKTYGGGYFDYGFSFQQITDGGFIVTGEIDSLIAPIVKRKALLLRTDSNGETLWIKTYSSASISNSVQQTSDGGFIIAGILGDINLSDVSIIRTDSVGDTLWTKIYGGINHDIGNSVQLTGDGGFIITGSTESFGAGLSDIYLIRTDSKGDSLWSKTYGGAMSDCGNSVQQIGDSAFIIVGTTGSFGAGYDDVYLIHTDSKGDSLWTKTFGGDSTDVGNSIQQTIDGGYIIVGSTNSFGAGGMDVYLIRLDKDTTAIQEKIPSNFVKTNNFIVSYNHGNMSIRYTIPYSTSVKLEAFDIQGRLVEVIEDQFMHKGSYSVTWDAERFGAGVYFINLKANGSEVSRKVTIVR